MYYIFLFFSTKEKTHRKKYDNKSNDSIDNKFEDMIIFQNFISMLSQEISRKK